MSPSSERDIGPKRGSLPPLTCMSIICTACCFPASTSHSYTAENSRYTESSTSHLNLLGSSTFANLCLCILYQQRVILCPIPITCLTASLFPGNCQFDEYDLLSTSCRPKYHDMSGLYIDCLVLYLGTSTPCCPPDTTQVILLNRV